MKKKNVYENINALNYENIKIIVKHENTNAMPTSGEHHRGLSSLRLFNNYGADRYLNETPTNE